MRLCDIAGCDRKHHARGLCSTHYRKRETPPPVSALVDAVSGVSSWARQIEDPTGRASLTAELIESTVHYLDKQLADRSSRPVEVASLVSRVARLIDTVGKIESVAAPTLDPSSDPFAEFLDDLDASVAD